MRFPQYWASAQTEILVDDRRFAIDIWRSSDDSQAAAVLAAREAAEAMRGRSPRAERPGCYGYGDHPLREEVLTRIQDERGREVAVISRNKMGCRVLNTHHALFVDIDYPTHHPSLLEQLKIKVDHWLGHPILPTLRNADEAVALERVMHLVRRHPDWQFRAYQTYGGMRVLLGHALFEPTDVTTLQIMDELAVDPLYRQLCIRQRCFRARLSPKPWRCGSPLAPGAFPRQSPNQHEDFAKWLGQYQRRSAHRAVCRLIGIYGAGTVHPQLQAIVQLHDDATGVGEAWPLA